MDKVVINTDLDIAGEIQAAFKNKSVVKVNDVGWLYLHELPAMKNPETSELVTTEAMTVLKFISVGVNGACKDDHSTFFDNQNIVIKEISIPGLAENLLKDRTVMIDDMEDNHLVIIKVSDFPFAKISQCKLSKEIALDLIKLPPFIKEIFDWDDPQTPEDIDNPRPRLKALEVI
jgi:hypothetical protein